MYVYLISTLSVQFLLVFEALHHLFHEPHCHLPFFQLRSCVLVLDHCMVAQSINQLNHQMYIAHFTETFVTKSFTVT